MKHRMGLLALAAVGLGALLGAAMASGQLNGLSHIWAATSPVPSPQGDATVLPPPEPPFLGHIGARYQGIHQGFSEGSESAERRAERTAYPDRRRGFRGIQHVWRPHSDADV